MMGILVLVVLGFYLALSIYAVKRAANYTQRRFGRGWIGGVLVGLIMYNLVFWDAIPTWYTHHHLCSTEAGLKVYQTPEEWAKENPERYKETIAAGRKSIKRSEDNSKAAHQWIEFALGLEYEFYHQWERDYAFHTGVERKRVIDKVTGKVMFETVNFGSSAGKGSLASGANTISDYKFWTVTGLCQRAYPSMGDRFKYHGRTFSDFLITMEGWNK